MIATTKKNIFSYKKILRVWSNELWHLLHLLTLLNGSVVTHPKVRSSKAVGGRDVVSCLGGVSVVGIDVSQ